MDKSTYEETKYFESANSLKKLRKSRQESQTEFWCRFGVTQSRGSRFEQGVEIPTPVAILVGLYLEQKVSDIDLQSAKENAGSTVNFCQKILSILGRDK
jgi:hypothetical protein